MARAGGGPALSITAALLGFLVWVHAAPLRAESFVDFLYIEANEGGSSGGHAALRFDDRVYHFEHVAPGLLRLRRASADTFAYTYATLANRPIHVQRLAIDDTASGHLRATLSRRQLAQDAQLDLRDALQRDVALFSFLRRGAHSGAAATAGSRAEQEETAVGEPRLQLPAAGLFADGSAAQDTPDELDAATTLHGLSASIGRKYRSDFLTARAEELHRSIGQLPLLADTDCSGEIDPDAFPRCDDPVSSRWQQLATAVRGLDILRQGRPLRPGSYQVPAEPDFRLSAAAVAAIDSQASQLESDLADLVGSSRPDWGFGFIVGMARLVTMRASVAQHRLIVAGDATSAAGMATSLDDDATLLQLLPTIEAEVTNEWRALLASVLTTHAFREADYTALELGSQRVIAVRRLMEGWRPGGDGTVPLYPSAGVDDAASWPTTIPSSTEIERAHGAADAYAAALARAYGYDLISRNCVTELTALLDAYATERVPRADLLTSLTALFRFIPFVASRTVAARHTVIAETVLPSYRQRLLARMSSREAPWMVALRESNTVTARAYRHWSHDSTFLLFTSEATWNRPLFGLTNLAVAAGSSALGVMQLALADPQPLIAGVRGMLYSLPELFFVNIRKGTFAFVPREEDPLAEPRPGRAE